MNCKSLCAQALKRLHFTCVVPPPFDCWVKRYFSGRRRGLRIVDKTLILENRRGVMVLPERCSSYILFINDDCRHPKVRRILLKPLLTLAEALARW